MATTVLTVLSIIVNQGNTVTVLSACSMHSWGILSDSATATFSLFRCGSKALLLNGIIAVLLRNTSRKAFSRLFRREEKSQSYQCQHPTEPFQKRLPWAVHEQEKKKPLSALSKTSQVLLCGHVLSFFLSFSSSVFLSIHIRTHALTHTNTHTIIHRLAQFWAQVKLIVCLPRAFLEWNLMWWLSPG